MIHWRVGDITPLRRPVNWANLRTDEAERVIRERANPAGSGKLIYTDHTWERVSEREINRTDIEHMLLEGRCLEQPHLNERNNWQVLFGKKLSGNRLAGAVTIILEKEPVLIIRTVEWIDP